MADWYNVLKYAKDNDYYIYVFTSSEEFGGKIEDIKNGILHLTPGGYDVKTPNKRNHIFIDISKINVVAFEGEYK